MRIQALRASEALLEESAGGSVPSISSFVMESSVDPIDKSSSPTGGRFLFGASKASDGPRFGLELGELSAIADLVCPILKVDWRDSELKSKAFNVIMCLGDLM